MARLKRPKSRLGRSADRTFRWILTGFATVVLAVLALMLVRTTYVAWPVFQNYGVDLVTKTRWFPGDNAYGALSFIYGTVVTSVIAILLAIPVSVGIALFVTEVAPRRLRVVFVYLVELLAAVPSVVYGLWGLLVLLPWLEHHAWAPISSALGFIPIFAGPANGRSFATAGVILAIMIIPIVTSIAREVIALVPHDHKEAALALGATRWEMMRLAVIPYARAGIIGGTMLGFGRALGETIAVALVIGGNPQISASIFQPGYTIASVIANQFNEATGFHIQALLAIGVLLFGITILVNMAGRLLVWRAARGLA